MSRDRSYALAATALVALVVILGFREIGSPAVQRASVADSKRIADFRQISNQIFALKRVPQALPELGKTWKDPERGTDYEYHPDSPTQYRLCASFNGAKTDNYEVFWNHGRGRTCFNLTISVYR